MDREEPLHDTQGVKTSGPRNVIKSCKGNNINSINDKHLKNDVSSHIKNTNTKKTWNNVHQTLKVRLLHPTVFSELMEK